MWSAMYSPIYKCRLHEYMVQFYMATVQNAIIKQTTYTDIYIHIFVHNDILLAHSILWWVYMGECIRFVLLIRGHLNWKFSTYRQTVLKSIHVVECTFYTYFNSIKSYIGTIWLVRDGMMSIQSKHKSSLEHSSFPHYTI